MLNQIDLSRVDLNLLVLFEVVMDELHVGRASERLNLSPSAVSHGLGRLRRLFHDPVFLRTPKGVVPSERALEIAELVRDVLAGARRVIASAAPFDPATSTRQFTVGAPDGLSAVFLPSLLERLRHSAGNIDIRVRQLLPPSGNRALPSAWEPVLDELDSRLMDVAIGPFETVPARFAQRILHEDDFVIVTSAGHPFACSPTMDVYCQTMHLVVSLSGDAHGFVDAALAELGRARRVAVTVPNFFMALALLPQSNFAAAVPRSFAAMYASRFGAVFTEAPLRLPLFKIKALAPKVALSDAGVAWLLDTIAGALAQMTRVQT